MQVTFFGAARVVTGSCYLLETGDHKIMVDCGLFQGSEQLKEKNYGEFPFNPKDIDFLLLTHAHIDHSGLIPKLCKKGFKGKIITTKATMDLCEVMLADSGHIQEMEVERLNRKRVRAGQQPLEPIYTSGDAMEAMKFFRPYHYGQIITLAPDITARFTDAGHILGSSIIELWVKEEGREMKLVFTGDLGNTNQPIIRDPEPIARADYLFMESTYGNRLHEERKLGIHQLQEVITETVRIGGNVIIPSFAVGRTQSILYELNGLLSKGLLPLVPVYVDSPLAISATEIFKRNPECYDSATLQLLAKGELPLDFPTLKFTRTTEESKALNTDAKGSIIISASGMCDAGRIKHHLKHNLWRPESSVILVGYQAEGTLGRRLQDGEKIVRIHGEDITVSANVYSIGSLSAHADQMGLINWANKLITPPRRVFVVHGEENSAMALANLLEDEMGLECMVPRIGDTFKLEPEGPGKLMASSASAISAAQLNFSYNFVRQAYILFKNSLRDLPVIDGASEDVQALKEDLKALLNELENISTN